MYMSGHHEVTTGVMCLDQSRAIVLGVSCFSHLTRLQLNFNVYFEFTYKKDRVHHGLSLGGTNRVSAC